MELSVGNKKNAPLEIIKHKLSYLYVCLPVSTLQRLPCLLVIQLNYNDKRARISEHYLASQAFIIYPQGTVSKQEDQGKDEFSAINRRYRIIDLTILSDKGKIERRLCALTSTDNGRNVQK